MVLLFRTNAAARTWSRQNVWRFVIDSDGEEAEPGEFPAVSALLFDLPDVSASDRQFCGASVIAPRWVLTAAHCLSFAPGQVMDANDLNVLIGSTSLDAADEIEIPASAIYIHPNYQSEPVPYNDIALIKLSEETDVLPLRLAEEDANRLAGNPAVVVGWGSTGTDSEGNDIYSSEQLKVTVPLVSRSVCNAVAQYGGLIAREHLCAGRLQGGVDSCFGDSGGPLLYRSEEGLFEQVGIVSFGNACAIPYSYGVYSSVTTG